MNKTIEFLKNAGIQPDGDGVGFIGDGNCKGTYFFWSERRLAWVVVNLDSGKVQECNGLALVITDNESDEFDPEFLNSFSLGCDLEGPGLWLIDEKHLLEVESYYGDNLVVRAVASSF